MFLIDYLFIDINDKGRLLNEGKNKIHYFINY